MKIGASNPHNLHTSLDATCSGFYSNFPLDRGGTDSFVAVPFVTVIKFANAGSLPWQLIQKGKGLRIVYR